MNAPFFLASQSPRRRQLLSEAGYRFEPLRAEVAEQVAAGESGLAYVRRIVADKLVAARAAAPDARPALVADTEVLLDDLALGKPADAAAAAAMLRRLSGRRHQVITRVALATAERSEAVETLTEIDFAPLSEPQIARYCASGEPLGKAGSYAIQGAAAGFIRELRGSYSGVIGLPVPETAALLAAFGIEPDA
jgi:septum formation protein